MKPKPFIKFSFLALLLIKVTSSNGQYKIIHNFNLTGGAGPQGSLLLIDPKLYGTSDAGGAYSAGTIFCIDTTGNNFKVLFSFDSANGLNPLLGTLTQSNGKFFGTTNYGGKKNDGVVFSIDTNGTNYKVLHSFDSIDGQYPRGKLALSGKRLFGGTGAGGTVKDYGVIYAIDTNGNNYKVLVDFNDSNGIAGFPSILVSGNRLFGTAEGGGKAKYQQGVVFTLDTSGTGFTILHSFGDSATDLADPETSLILTGNILFGEASEGGASGLFGGIYELNTNGSGYKPIYSFTSPSSTGESPYGPLALSGNTLMGMAPGGIYGGCDAGNCGVMYSIDTTGSNFNLLKDFNDTIGGLVTESGVTISGQTIYGITEVGGKYNDGVIFKYSDTSLSTGINELKINNEGVKVFPTPFSNSTSVVFSTDGKHYLEIYDITGRKLESMACSGKQYELSRNGLVAGIYFIRVFDAGQRYSATAKIVVQ